MPSTFSQSLRIELIGAGEQSGTWNITTNNNLGSLIEQAISGNTPLDVTLGNITLTALNGVVDQSRSAVLSVSGTPGTTRVLTIPNVTKLYTIRNSSDSTVQIKTATGAAYSVPAAAQANIFCDGNNVITGRTITDGAQTLLSSQTPFNNVALTGVPTAPTAAVGTNTTQIATTAFVQSTLPAGVIVMWSGSIATIPSGWALCNGAGGTPDLRDRFVVGAGSSYAVGNTGGANTVTLTTSNIPSHTHSISGSGTTSGQSNDHTHSGTTAATNVDHTHNGSGTTGNQSNDHVHGGSGTTSAIDINHTHNGSGTTGGFSNDHTHSGATGSENQNHTHTFSANTGGQSANHVHGVSGTTGGGGAHTHTTTHTYEIWNSDGPSENNTGGNGRSIGSNEINGVGDHTHFFSVSSDINNQDHFHGVNGTTAGISNNHQHAFTTGGASANHTHNYSFTTAGMNSNNVHSHTYSFTTGGVSANHNHAYSFTTGGMNSNTTHTHTITTGGVSAGHTHTFSFSGTSGAEGGGTAHENRPPYYALAYIMKL